MQYARVSRRYALRDVVTFRCQGSTEVSSGITENISATGILFETDAAVQLGARIDLKLHLRARSDEVKMIHLQAHGTVVRFTVEGDRNKVAAEIRFDEEFEEGLPTSQMIQ